MRPRRKESGFALLLVFVLAACVAITLYMEIPRVAFEAERQRELLLVDRGNQFKRAIQVFITDKTNNPTRRYPASLDELESFNNHRYLRRRYVDPMTGKDEWRLVHIQGGVLTDSVTTKPTTGTNQTTSNTPNPPAYISEQSYMDTGAGGARGGGVARAMNRRASDTQQPGGPGDTGTGNTAGGTPGIQGFAGNPGPGGAPSPNGGPAGGLPGQAGTPPTSNTNTPAPQPCTVYIGACPQAPASGQQGQTGQQGGPPGIPPQPGMGVSAQGGAGAPGAGGAEGLGLPGTQMNPQAQSAAASMIQGLLTSPRPGGMPTNMPGSTVGGGIAGVASKYEADGIMVINDRTAINEWEYIFDATKYRAPPNPISGTVGTPIAPMGGGPGGTQPPPMTNGPAGPMTGKQ